LRQPFSDRPLQKFFDLNAIATDEQRALHLERRREGRNTRMRPRRPTALYFDRGQSRTPFDHKIYFLAAIPPIEELALPRGRRVGKMGADRG
jgi:hypothetical protein